MNKKIILLLIIFCVLINHNIFALDIGVRIGGSLSRITGDDTDNLGVDTFRNKFGFIGGAFINIDLIGSVLSFQPELLYIQKGYKSIVRDIEPRMLENPKYQPVGTYDIENLLELDYIELPLLANITIPTKNNQSVSLIFGPSLSINAKANLKVKIDYDELLEAIEEGLHIISGKAEDFVDSEEELDVKDAIKDTSLNLITGLSLNVNSFLFEFRYTMGLSSISEPEETSSGTESIDIKNNLISLMFGYRFYSKKNKKLSRKKYNYLSPGKTFIDAPKRNIEVENDEKDRNIEETAIGIKKDSKFKPQKSFKETDFEKYRKKLQIDHCLKKANQFIEDQEYNEAKNEIIKVLKLDPSNNEAQQLFDRINDVMYLLEE